MSQSLAKRSLRELLALAKEDAPGWKLPLFQRCALLTAIDARAYEKLLKPEVPNLPLSFEEWRDLPEVGRVPGTTDAFYLKDDARAEALVPWHQDPHALKRFSDRALRFYTRAQPLERLTHQLFADPREGLEQCRRFYEAADRRADLSTCEAILRILRNRSALLMAMAPNTFAYLQQQEQYLRSRVAFANDYARSSHYLERPEITRKVTAFLADRKKWFLQIYAAGGMGKSAFLSWLIARRLVVQRQDADSRLPVARIDFDFVSRRVVAAAPCLLLVDAAGQLDRQLSSEHGSSVFRRFRDDYEERFAAALLPAARRADEQSPPLRVELTAAEAERIETDFGDQLVDREVLIGLDTIEEMVLHHPAGWLAALHLLTRLHAACPGLKVMASGRLDLNARREFDAWTTDADVQKGMDTLALPELEADDALKYLTEKRQLKPAFRLRDEKVAEKLDKANPFNLALMADRIGVGGTVTLEDLSELREGVVYLVRRIIERVPDCELQWLLRYVVVPNALTKEFVSEVLIPHVRYEAQHQRLDRPHEDLPAKAAIVRTSTSWQPCTAPFDVNQLWLALCRYAASSSWIKMVDDQPALQPELMVPMRYLLRSQAVHAAVHTDAAKYFERKAVPFGPDAANHTIEALYHWFQAEGDAAVAHWRRLISGPKSTPRFVIEVTASLLTGYYLDDAGQPLPHIGEQPIISLETLAEAHVELARARAFLLMEAAPSDRGVLAKAIARDLEALADREQQLGRMVIPPARYAVAEAALQWQGDQARQAPAMVERALVSPDLDTTDRVLLKMVGGMMAAVESADAAVQHYGQAAAIASDPNTRLIFVDMIRSRLGRLEFQRGRLDAAASAFEAAAAAVVERQGSPTLHLTYLRSAIEVHHQSARWSAIPRLIAASSAFATDEDAVQRFVDEQRRRLDVATYRWALVDSSQPESSSDAQWRAQRMALVQHPQTVDAFRTAIRLFVREGDLVSAQSSEIDLLDYVLTTLGNISAARSLASFDPTGANWFRGTQVLIDLERQVSASRARALWERTWKEAIDRKLAPRDRAAALAFAMAGHLVPRADVVQLAALLFAVTPATGRLGLVSAFEFWLPTADEPLSTAANLVAALPALSDDDPDFVLRALLLADVLRYAGDYEAARTLLHRVLAHKPPADQPLLMRRVLGALRRAGVPPEAARVDQFLLSVKALCAPYPSFVFAAHVEQAEWYFECGLPDAARRIFQELELPQGEPDRFQCRYLALRSWLAEHEADFDRFARQARGMAVQLGQPERFVELDHPLPQMAGPPPPAGAVQLDIQAPLRRVQIATAPQGGVSVIHGARTIDERTFETTILGSPLGDVIASKGSNTRSLEALLGNPEEGATALAALFNTPALVRDQAAAATGLSVEFDDATMESLPWQWVVQETAHPFLTITRRDKASSDAVKWLQVMLQRLPGSAPSPHALMIDGVAGPMTSKVVADADRRFHILDDGRLGARGRLVLRQQVEETVFVLSQGYEIERSERSGYGGFGIDVVRPWHEARSVAYRPAKELSGELLAQVRPTLLHIAMSISRSGSELRLSASTRLTKGDTPTDLTPATIGRMLDFALSQQVRPFIVLDVPYQGPRAETLKLLLLRNQFASQLADIAQTTVLAVGLAGDGTQEMLNVLIEHAVAGKTPADFVRATASLLRPAPPGIFGGDPTVPL